MKRYEEKRKSHIRRGKLQRIAALALTMFFLATALSGCGKKEEVKEEKAGTVVFRYGDNVVTKGEVCIYINTVKERYELQYGADVWQLSLPVGDENVSVEKLTREAVVEEIVKIKTLNQNAKNMGISLTEEEEAQARQKAEEFVKGLTDAQIDDMEITVDKAYQVFLENSIAARVEAEILGEQNIEISDEEARMTTFYDMYFACYSISEEGTVTPFTDEERQQQRENALQACSDLATAALDGDEDAQSIEKLAETYQLEQAGSKTMTTQEIYETYGEEIFNLLYSMSNGQYSTVVESEYGYHIFQMVALTDQKATNTRKILLHDEAVNAQLADTINGWRQIIDSGFSYPESVDMDVYDSIVLK